MENTTPSPSDKTPAAATPPSSLGDTTTEATAMLRRGVLGWICHILPWQPKMEELPTGMTREVKAEFIAQEHRLFHLIRNALIYGRCDADDPRHQAAFTAGLWRICVSPEAQTALLAGGGALIAICTAILTWQGLKIAEQQRNQAMIQNALAEANRMAVLHGEFGTLLKEMKAGGGPPDSVTQMQIAALCRTLRPYKALDWKKDDIVLETRALSRERGELLIACVVGMSKVPRQVRDDYPYYREFDFSGADLVGADLQGADLAGCALQNSSLRGAKLARARLNRANFAESDLENATLSLWKVHGFSATKLPDGKWMVGKIDPEDISSLSTLWRANFQDASLRGVSAQRVSFDEANLDGANLKSAYLMRAAFPSTLMPHPDLLLDADLQGVDLTDAHVAQSDWIERLSQQPGHGLHGKAWKVIPLAQKDGLPRKKGYGWKIVPRVNNAADLTDTTIQETLDDLRRDETNARPIPLPEHLLRRRPKPTPVPENSIRWPDEPLSSGESPIRAPLR